MRRETAGEENLRILAYCVFEIAQPAARGDAVAVRDGCIDWNDPGGSARNGAPGIRMGSWRDGVQMAYSAGFDPDSA
jgi:hypothetical protein